MKLLVIRHGKAADPDPYSRRDKKSDARRPLTRAGRKDIAQMAKALRALVPDIDLVASSPLLRARQTADIIATDCCDKPVYELSALAPGAGAALLSWLAKQKGGYVLAIVGHEPDLSRLVGRLIAGGSGSCIEMKKGAVCCVEFAGRAGVGRGHVAWLLAPEQVRDLI